MVATAKNMGCIGIAYTYNEPIISAEWVREVARQAHRSGLKNVLVTNGFVTPEAREGVFKYIDAVNVDLKSFSESFYRKMTLSHLDPVVDTLCWLISKKYIWVEITNLIIPGVNDSQIELTNLVRFIISELDPRIPLHFSAFHPAYKMLNYPTTPIQTLRLARRIARESGLQFVYLGNILTSDGQSTNCPHCNLPLILRKFYPVRVTGLVNGVCKQCGIKLPGRFVKM